MANKRKLLDELWEEATGSGKQGSGSSSAVDDSYVNQFITDANSYMDTINEIINGISYRTAKGTSYTQSRITEDLQERANNIITYLDENQDWYDAEAYQSLRSQIEKFQSVAAEGKKAAQSARDYYAQWDTEDAYNTAMRQNAYLQKYQGKGYQELVPLLDGLEDGEEKTWLKDYAGYVDYDERVNMDLDAANQEIQALQDELNRARNLEENYNEYRHSPLLMLTQGDTWRNLESRYDAFIEKYGSIEKLQANIEKKRLRMAEGKQTQDSIRQTAELKEWQDNVRDPKLVQKELDRVNQAIALNEQAIRRNNQGSSQQDMQLRREAEAGKQTLEQQRTELERELQYGRMRDYMALMERSDFREKSQYVPSGNGVRTMAKGDGGGVIRDPSSGMYVDTGFADLEYDYVNRNDRAKIYESAVGRASDMKRLGLDKKWMQKLTDDELAVYNYLYHTEGKESASEYLDLMRGTLNQRQRAEEEKKWAKIAQEHPVLASGASVLMSPLKAVSAIGQAVDYAGDRKIDQNASYNRASYISAAIRDQVTQQIQQNEKWGQLGAFGYQTAMSMGDFLMNGAVGGGLFGVPGVTLAIMGSGAAADAVISAKDRGLADGQAFELGIVAGLAEALTERFSLETLLDADLLKNGIGVYMLKNSLTEGSEEAASGIINMAADILVTKEKSEWQQAIRDYQDQGYSEKEAFGKAMADQAASLGMDFLGGVLSGGIMSGARSAMYYTDTRRTGRAMGRQGLTDPGQVQQILDAGADAGKGTAANAVAGQLQKKIDAGRQLSQYEKGRLYQANPQTVGEAVFGQGRVSRAPPTTQGISNQDERWQQAQRLASITGRDIKFYNGAENENGYFDRKTGEIYVNTNAADTIAQVVSHELTHSTELAESYGDLARYVRGKIRAEGRDWDLMKQRKAESYAQQGHPLENDADIEAEIVAEYVQTHLLTNEQEIYEAVWESPTLGQRILNWIDSILAKLNNQKAKERQMLNNTRAIYARALDESRSRKTASTTTQRKQTQSGTKTAGQQYAPEDLKYMDQLYREQYNRGEITEEEYDEYLAWREHETAAEEGQEELGRQYSFAGEKARTADLQKLTQAKQMESQGVSSETIRQQTGWFRGMDKKWRFEIDDSRMKYHRAGDALFSEMHPDYARHQELMKKWLYGELDVKEENEFKELDEVWGREHQRLSDRVRRGNATLQNILNHDELFEAYPELRGAKVIFEDMEDGKRGQYDPNTNSITLSNKLRNAPQETLLHEVQHAIQSVENFTGGASVEYWKEQRRDIVETIAAARKNLDLWLADIGYPEVNRQSLLAVSRREKPLEQHWKDMEEFKANSEFARQIAACEAEIADFQRQYDEITHGMTAYDQYENTAGEIEARDTANRWKIGLDEEGRKNTPPDLGDERTVFAGADSWMAELDEAYADRENYVDADISEQETEAGIREVATMEPVVQVAGTEFAKGDVDLITQVDLFFGQRNNEAYNPQIGTVILDRKGVKSDIGHGIGRKKAAAFAAVPDVIEKGRVVDYQKNWKSRGYDTAVIAAPILIGEEEHISAVIAIRSRNTNLFYVHEVLTTRNGAMPFKTGARKSGLPSGDAPSIFSILNRIVEVKNNGKDSSGDNQFSLAGAATLNKRDVARDLRAILSRGGDPRELQRYVDGLEQTGRKAEQTGKKRDQTGENRNSTAREILETAHSQGQSVEEYLRWNPEQFERDGRWRPEALEAMRMEQGGGMYSLNEETEGSESNTEIPQESTESQARGIVRDNLPTKARNYLARAESKLLNSIGEALSVPRYARYNSLRGIIQEISDVYLAEGTISDEKMELLFDKAYAEGIVSDSAFFEQYKKIKDHLRSTGITISEQDRSDIADFDDFRKRAFGTLRILNEGGLPVDSAYHELNTMAPELFPEAITHPADQLVRMYDVAQSIAVSQKSLDEYYGPEREEFRKWAKNDFEAAVADAMGELRQVKRYAEDRAEEAEVKKILTPDEAEEAFQELKKLRRNVDKVRAKNILTESDETLLGRMLKGEIGPQHLNPNQDNVKGITALYEAKLAYESQNEVLAAYKRSVRAKRLQDADRFLETAGNWKDKKAGILYARETMRRNIMDIVPDRKLAEEIAEFYFEAVHQSEAQSTKFKTEYRDRVRALDLSRKVMKGNQVSEAHAVQLLGEAMDNIRVMENARGRMGMRDGKTLAEWRAVVDDLWMNNTGLDKGKIENAVAEFRKIYDELFQQMNRIRVENGYEPVNYRQGYFPHFQPGGGDGIMGFFGKALGINTQVDALPTTINGLTHTFKPGIQWFGNAQERIGFNTAYDAVEGFDMYIEGVASVIFQTENIQKLRALATQVRYRTSDEGIRKQVDFVRMDNRLTEEEKQREINAIYEHGRFALSNFVAELDEYTNLLANKKSKYDRTMESLIGRRAYTLMKAWENRVGANMIAGNISSALTNFIPLTQAGAQLDSGMILKGMLGTLRNIKNGDSFAGMSDFLTNRRGSDVLVKTWMQKASGVMGTPMELIDNFTSESIVRAAYMQNLKRGLSESEAIHQADIFASGVMADRSKGAMPTLFESRNPLFKAFTQFQLEVNNQFSEVFKDLPRIRREKNLAVLAMVLLKYFLGAWLYNELFEKLIGRRSALDPIGILVEAWEDLTGYEIPNLFDMISGERIEKTGEGSIGDAGANLMTNILSELPFSAGLTLFGVETDGGRLPAASAVPDLSAIWDAATERELTGDQRWKMIQDELHKLAYVVPPFGGGQISKSWKGIKAYLEGGSYGMNQDGEEILQYPVYKDDPDDAFWNLVRAALLGKNSLPEAQDWVEAGYNSLNAQETAVYRDMLDAGVKDRDAFGMIQDIQEIADTETEAGARRAAQRRLVMKSDLSDDGKAVVYYGLVATEKEQEWMDELADAGADQGKSLVFVQNLHDAENLKGTDKKAAQAATFLDSPLTEEEKQVAIGFIMDTELETESGNPAQYAKFLTAMETGLTVDKYMEIRSSETDIDDYLELTDLGIKGEKAADLAISIDALEPTEGYDKVHWTQKGREILESALSEAEQMAAIREMTGVHESTYKKIEIGRNFGMNLKSYIDLKSVMYKFDSDGNGSYSKQETEDAINALAGDDNVLFALTGTTPNGYTLTDREKAILWQLQDKRWGPKNNPFDREVGQMVYDILTAEDPEDAVVTAESGTGFDVASLLALMG